MSLPPFSSCWLCGADTADVCLDDAGRSVVECVSCHVWHQDRALARRSGPAHLAAYDRHFPDELARFEAAQRRRDQATPPAALALAIVGAYACRHGHPAFVVSVCQLRKLVQLALGQRTPTAHDLEQLRTVEATVQAAIALEGQRQRAEKARQN